VETRKVLREHAHIMTALVDHLMEHEEMLADAVQTFFDQYGLHTPSPSFIRDGEERRLLPDDVLKPLPTPTGRVAAEKTPN
jgi:hypothetical protein